MSMPSHLLNDAEHVVRLAWASYGDPRTV